jgi:hypothetical protein
MAITCSYGITIFLHLIDNECYPPPFSTFRNTKFTRLAWVTPEEGFFSDNHKKFI